jgi:hypothetical protein
VGIFRVWDRFGFFYLHVFVSYEKQHSIGSGVFLIFKCSSLRVLTQCLPLLVPGTSEVTYRARSLFSVVFSKSCSPTAIEFALIFHDPVRSQRLRRTEHVGCNLHLPRIGEKTFAARSSPTPYFPQTHFVEFIHFRKYILAVFVSFSINRTTTVL